MSVIDWHSIATDKQKKIPQGRGISSYINRSNSNRKNRMLIWEQLPIKIFDRERLREPLRDSYSPASRLQG